MRFPILNLYFIMVLVGCTNNSKIIENENSLNEKKDDFETTYSAKCYDVEGVLWTELTNENGIPVFKLSNQDLQNSNHRYCFKGKPYTGLCKSCHENGATWAVSNYYNGKMHGITESFHENGQLRHHTNYNKGMLNGVETWFDKNGELERTIQWKNDTLVSCEGKCEEYN